MLIDVLQDTSPQDTMDTSSRIQMVITTKYQVVDLVLIFDHKHTGHRCVIVGQPGKVDITGMMCFDCCIQSLKLDKAIRSLQLTKS